MIEEDTATEEVPHEDKALCDRLREAGCKGPLWERAAVTFAKLGWSVMEAWLVTGVIAGKCREKGRPVELPRDWTPEDREELVAAAVATGLETFRQALESGRWKPDQGASLRTYFVGSCVLAFPNVLRRWQSERTRYRKAKDFLKQEVAAREDYIKPVDVVDAVDALKRLSSGENERNRAIWGLYHLYEHTPAEIAHVMGMSPGAVSAVLRRMAQRRRSGERRSK
ncbi:hypothetical protein OU415_01770 [Saccharopolyspora sp. WRP15-2]|uniref:Sigma-70 family RNA polymerase sigma factor n=1 Tax=Saccharopolyspora oryzae TaxID=2997343 RepID=A0ABT4UQY3_9PSEU|nr:hypothetical protein [Saccharopolyspora oryzae]MDA3624142.1 hypothetical protein [Saccharopolyspora oryzae]